MVSGASRGPIQSLAIDKLGSLIFIKSESKAKAEPESCIGFCPVTTTTTTLYLWCLGSNLDV